VRGTSAADKVVGELASWRLAIGDWRLALLVAKQWNARRHLNKRMLAEKVGYVFCRDALRPELYL
jgi:hypothetical protein